MIPESPILITDTYSIETWFLASLIQYVIESLHNAFKQHELPRLTVVLLTFFWHCALISIFLGKGKERVSLVL